jgi:hypothetical protein
LGGCFLKDVAQFKENAEFWGHCSDVDSRIDTLANWIAEVNSWDGSAELELHRTWMKQ